MPDSDIIDSFFDGVSSSCRCGSESCICGDNCNCSDHADLDESD